MCSYGNAGSTSILKGTWCSGITFASHAEGPGFKSQCVHIGHRAKNLLGCFRLPREFDFGARARFGAFRIMRLQRAVATCHSSARSIPSRQFIYKVSVAHTAQGLRVGCVVRPGLRVGCVVRPDFTFGFSHRAFALLRACTAPRYCLGAPSRAAA